MKKIILAALMLPLAALAQTYPSPTFNSVTLQNPLSASGGGTGVANPSTITLGGNLTTSGANPLTLTTTGTTNVTLPTSGTILNSTSGATAGANSNITSLSGLTTPLSVSQGGTGTTTSTGSGSNVLSTSPSLTTPALGIPSSVTLTNGTGLPISTGVSGLGTGVATALVNAVTGSGSIALSASPTFTGSPAAPTAAQFDNTANLATTAFTQKSLGGYSGWVLVTPPATLDATYAGNYISINGSAAVTLPLASTFSVGAALHFTAVTDAASVITQGSDSIFSRSGALTAMNLNIGDELTLAAKSGGWYVKNVKHAACANIMDYGGNNVAGANNDTAFTNALSTESLSSQKCVYFPSGYYNFASAISYTLPNTLSSITVKGDGPNVSNLYWASNGGISVTMPGGSGNSAHIRDLSVLGGATGSGNGIALINATNNAAPQPSEISDITNVSIHGSDGYAITHYWSNAVYVASWSNINFTNVMATGGGGGGDLSGYSAQGIGAYLTGSSGSSAPPQATALNFSNCFFNYLNMGIQYSNWVQGVTVNQTNFTGGKYGIYVASPDQGQDQLAVIGSQFNESDAGIFDNVGVPALMLIGNYFLIPTPSASNAGIQLNSEYEAVVSGNTFQRVGASATGTNGLIVGSNQYAGTMVTGNVFTGLGTGIFLENTSSGNNVQSNSYHANSTNIFDSGTSNVKGGGSP